MDDWKLKAQVVVEIETENCMFVSSYLYEFIDFQRLFALKNSLLCSLSISTVYASMTVT